MPFRNLTGDNTLDYLADGLAEEVSRTLTGVDALTVSGRSLQSMDAGADAIASGRELGVAYVVTGSVRRAGQRLRLTASLIEVGRGNSVWSNNAEVESYALHGLRRSRDARLLPARLLHALARRGRGGVSARPPH